MPKSVRKKPSYLLHKPTGQARVIISGKTFYLGPFGSPQSRARYDELVAEWFDRSDVSRATITVDDLVIRFMAHADRHYRKGGRPTSEVHCLRLALKYVVALFGPTLARSFGPRSLRQVRDAMVKDGHCRASINQHCSRIRRVFKWGVCEELLPPEILTGLQSVRGLDAGRTDAVESEPVVPVPVEHVDAIKPFLTAPVLGLVEFQLATGCRPGEAITARAADITMPPGAPVWEYRPRGHKLAHKRKARVVYLGPAAQAVVRRFLTTDTQAPLFSPRAVRQPEAGATRQPGEKYDLSAYRNSIKRACRKAGVPEWHPNQLRHTFGTIARREAGVDAARVLLGHSKLATTEIYAEADGEKARAVVAKIG